MQHNRNTSPRQIGNSAPATVMWPRIAVLTSTFLLVVLGIVMVYSASSIVNIAAEVEAHADALKQLVCAGLGIAACVVFALMPYRWWRGPLTWACFAGSAVLLVLTATIGTEELGAQRWVNIGPVSLQPSEFAKIFLLLAVAKLVEEYRQGELDSKWFRRLFAGLNLVIVGLVFVAQSDLGTTLICFVGMVAILWFAEIPLPYIGAYSAGICGLGIIGLMQGYRLQRLLIFTHPWDDYYGAGYQIIHSMYAFAQGGIFGAGLGNSAEKYLYLPEASTDFIFSVVGEELGLFGALFIIAMFVVFLLGGLRMAQEAPDSFGSILCGSFAVIIVFQAFLNIGCVIGLMPITGKPLPFVSAGGSSLIASFMMVGIMLSVSRMSGESPVYAQRRESIRPVDRDDYEDDRRVSGRGAYGRSSGRAVYDGRFTPTDVRSARSGRGYALTAGRRDYHRYGAG